VFLGTLREIELERVKEKLSSAIMETCLALTIFREEFNIGFVGMFTVLTFVKVCAVCTYACLQLSHSRRQAAAGRCWVRVSEAGAQLDTCASVSRRHASRRVCFGGAS
jgi:hypothetical protein